MKATRIFALVFLPLLSAAGQAAIVSTPDIYNDESIFFDAEQASWWDSHVNSGWSALNVEWTLDNATFQSGITQFSLDGLDLSNTYGVGNHVVSVIVDWINGGSTQTLSENETILIYGSNAPSPVPIPAGAWLFGSALLGLVAVKRRI